MTRELTGKRHIFSAPDINHLNKSELRRIAEAEATGGPVSPLRALGEKVVPIR
jgi:hypothetical protein